MRLWIVRNAFLGAISLLLISGCEEKIKPSVLEGLDSRSIPQQESWNSTIVISDSGRTNAIIHAGYIQVFEYEKHTLLSEGVTVKFFNDLQEHTSTLTSREGKVDDRTNDLEATGDVIVVSRDNTRLETSKLLWDNARRLIHTPDFVSITSPKEKIQGRGFEADQHLRNYKIFHVSGEARTE